MALPNDVPDGQPGQSQRPTREELEALFARNLPHARAFVRLRIDAVTREMEDISDILQSACRELLASDAFEFRGELAFRSYLCQAALHKIQNRRRHYSAKKRDAGVTRPLAAPDSQLEHIYRTTLFDPHRAAVRSEEIARLESAFDQLPDDYREALTFFRIAGMPIADLAKRIGRTEGATRTLLNRAMARLTSVLEPEGEV